MTDRAIIQRPRPILDTRKALSRMGAVWFVTAALGQLAFVIYIAGFYYVASAQGDFERIDGRVIHGFLQEDPVGNALFLSHVLVAFWITASGPLQLIPQVRNRFRTFHRWNGRFYVTIAVFMSLGALYLTYSREKFGATQIILVNTLDAVLIISFALLALRAAMQRRFDDHRRWALRMFIAVSGVWFFRVGYGFYFLATSGQMPGTTRTLTGPADIAAASTWLFALLVLELYFLAQRRKSGPAKATMAIALAAATAFTAVGSVGASMIFWLPTLMS